MSIDYYRCPFGFDVTNRHFIGILLKLILWKYLHQFELIPVLSVYVKYNVYETSDMEAILIIVYSEKKVDKCHDQIKHIQFCIILYILLDSCNIWLYKKIDKLLEQNRWPVFEIFAMFNAEVTHSTLWSRTDCTQPQSHIIQLTGYEPNFIKKWTQEAWFESHTFKAAMFLIIK